MELQQREYITVQYRVVNPHFRRSMWGFTTVKEVIKEMICNCFFQCDIGTGSVILSGGVNFTMDSDSLFTLTCISTGGPATTVTWTRDSTTVTQGTQTVLNDPVTANYTHTLTVTGRLPGGLYRCTVANSKPSTVSAELKVQGIIIMMMAFLCVSVLL